jgi:hypothetical protein
MIHVQRISIVAPFILHEPRIVWLKTAKGRAKQYAHVRIMFLHNQSTREMFKDRLETKAKVHDLYNYTLTSVVL